MIPSFTVGARVRATTTFTDPSSTTAPADPATGKTLVDPDSVTAQVRNPAGVWTAVAPTRLSQGVYATRIDLDAPGRWRLRVAGTGNNRGASETEFEAMTFYPD